MAFEDTVRGSKGKEGSRDVAAMHDFIRKQAVNQEADYSVRALSVCVYKKEKRSCHNLLTMRLHVLLL